MDGEGAAKLGELGGMQGAAGCVMEPLRAARVPLALVTPSLVPTWVFAVM